MNRLVELAGKLTPTQLKEVVDFAETVMTRSTASASQDRYLDVDAFAGMFSNLAPEKTSVELVHEANDAMSAKYEKYFK